MLMPPCSRPNGWRARSDIGIRRRIPSASAETISTPRASGAVFGSSARSCSTEVTRVEVEDIELESRKISAATGRHTQLLNFQCPLPARLVQEYRSTTNSHPPTPAGPTRPPGYSIRVRRKKSVPKFLRNPRYRRLKMANRLSPQLHCRISLAVGSQIL